MELVSMVQKKLFCILFGVLCFLTRQCAESVALVPRAESEKEKDHLKELNIMQLWSNWFNGQNASSRWMARDFIIKRGYKSILDVGCGLCMEYYGYLNVGYTIAYCGVDLIKEFVDCAVSNGIKCCQGSVDKLPQDDESYELVYARHVLEYIDYYEKALKEMLRVAQKAVVVIFSEKPYIGDDIINRVLLSGTYIYHNKYNQDKIETFVKSIESVKSVRFIDCVFAPGDKDAILFCTGFESMLVIEKV